MEQFGEDFFAGCAREVLQELPECFRVRLQNLHIRIEQEPSEELLRSMQIPDDEWILGLYEGVALTERSVFEEPELPDVIRLFRVPILEAAGDSAQAIREEIRVTLLHEIAHYFGLSDDRLHELGAY